MTDHVRMRIDPTIRGLVCCLLDLEQEALSLGHDLAANLIAAAQLALTNAERDAVNDNRHLPLAVLDGSLGIKIGERQGVIAGG